MAEKYKEEMFHKKIPLSLIPYCLNENVYCCNEYLRKSEVPIDAFFKKSTYIHKNVTENNYVIVML